MPNNNMTPAEPERSTYTLTYDDGTTRTVEGVAVLAIGDGGFEFYADPADFYGVATADLEPMDTAPAGATLTERRDPRVDDTQIPAVAEIDNPDVIQVGDDGFPVLETDNYQNPYKLLGGV